MTYETYKKSVLLQASIFLTNPFRSHWLNGRREVELYIAYYPNPQKKKKKKTAFGFQQCIIYVAFLEMLLVLFFFFFFIFFIEATLINLIIRKLVLTFWLIRCKVYKRIFFYIPSSKNIMLSL